MTDALASTKFVAQNKADMGYPSPGVLTASIDSGMGVKSVWNVISGQVFNFGLPANSKIKSPKELEGKSISLGSSGWKVIVDPMLVELGIDPKSVRYVSSGSSWMQAVATGKADAGLAWEGLRAQLAGQGLKLKYLIGTDWSKHPSNVYSIRAADLEDPAKKDLYTRFLQGVVMGLEFTKANPRAAAQITYRSLPDLQKTLKPQLALDSMLELAHAYGTSHLKGQGWGYNDAKGWANYLKVVKGLGQTKKLLSDEGRDHERAAGGREPEGRSSPGRARTRRRTSSTRTSRRRRSGPASRCSRSVSGRSRSPGAPRHPCR